MSIYLVGDIGGTHTRLALISEGIFLKEARYENKNFGHLIEIVHQFKDREVEKACFGVAGYIEDQKCKMTNLNWTIDAKSLAQKLEIPSVCLINDLEAIGFGLHRLKPDDFFILNKGVEKKGNKALIASGTGLGESCLFFDGKGHIPFATEGGHVDFSAVDTRDIEFSHFLKKTEGHVSFDKVICGPGMEKMYEFLHLQKYGVFCKPENLAKKITEHSPCLDACICDAVLEWFITLYARECANVALKFLAINGVYMGGGIVLKILRSINEKNFMQAFKDKGRFSHLLQDIPIKVILNQNVALLGAFEAAGRL